MGCWKGLYPVRAFRHSRPKLTRYTICWIYSSFPFPLSFKWKRVRKNEERKWEKKRHHSLTFNSMKKATPTTCYFFNCLPLTFWNIFPHATLALGDDHSINVYLRGEKEELLYRNIGFLYSSPPLNLKPKQAAVRLWWPQKDHAAFFFLILIMHTQQLCIWDLLQLPGSIAQFEVSGALSAPPKNTTAHWNGFDK